MEAPELTCEEERIRGQALIMSCIFGFVDLNAIKCVIDLGIPDMISSHGGPMSLLQIVHTINHPSLQPDRLSRVMALLVLRGIFNKTPSESGEENEALYGLTAASKLLLTSSETNMASMAMSYADPLKSVLWERLGDCVKEGCTAYSKCFGMDFWQYMSGQPEKIRMVRKGLADASKITIDALNGAYYKEGLQGVSSVVDVGGGDGALVGDIVKKFPHVKGVNFELPHVVAGAPNFPGVSHVAGDIFTSDIPQADALVLKQVLHDWDDEKCIKILQNCRRSIPLKTGKIIVIELVLHPQGNDLFDGIGAALDLTMMVYLGSKERTESEWKKLLEAGGFPCYKIIKIPNHLSVIEAYPEEKFSD